MAEPKKRTNSSKQGMRRMHDKVAMPAINYCSNCKEPKLAHSVCRACGFYDGKLIVESKTKTPESEKDE